MALSYKPLVDTYLDLGTFLAKNVPNNGYIEL